MKVFFKSEEANKLMSLAVLVDSRIKGIQKEWLQDDLDTETLAVVKKNISNLLDSTEREIHKSFEVKNKKIDKEE